MKRVVVHIDRLVLHGLRLAPGEGLKVLVAMEAELSRLLQQRGIAPAIQRGGEIASIRTRPLQVSGKAAPLTLGVQIAQSVSGGIGK